MGWSLLKTPNKKLRLLGVLSHCRVFSPPRINKPASLNLRGAGSGGDRKHSSCRVVPFPRGKPESPLDGGHAAGLWGEGCDTPPHPPSRPGLSRGTRSRCHAGPAQAGTGRLGGLTPPLFHPSPAPPGRGPDAPPRAPALRSDRERLPTPEAPSDGKRTRLDQPTRKPSPSSHLLARDARSCARPPACPGPAIRGAPSLRAGRHPRPSPPGGQTHHTPAPTERELNAAAPAGARALPPPLRPCPSRARSLARTRTRCASA